MKKYIMLICFITIFLVGCNKCGKTSIYKLTDDERVKVYVSRTYEFFDKVNSFKNKISDYSTYVGIDINEHLLKKLNNNYQYFPSINNFIGEVVNDKSQDDVLSAKLVKDMSLDDINKKYKDKHIGDIKKFFGTISLKKREISKVFEEKGTYTVFTKYTYNASNIDFKLVNLKGSYDFSVYKRFVFNKTDKSFELYSLDTLYFMEELFKKAYAKSNKSDVEKEKKYYLKDFNTYRGSEFKYVDFK